MSALAWVAVAFGSVSLLLIVAAVVGGLRRDWDDDDLAVLRGGLLGLVLAATTLVLERAG